MFIDNLLLKIADLYYNPKLKSGDIDISEFKEKDIIFRQNAYNIFITIFSVLLGYFLGIFQYVLIFYLVFNILRIFSNGYHSYGNVTYCAILYTVLSLSFIYLAIHTVEFYMLYLILNIILYFYIYNKSPFCNNEEELCEYSKSKINHKIGVTITYILYLIISLILKYFNLDELSNIILASNLMVALFMNKYVCKVISKIRFLIYHN